MPYTVIVWLTNSVDLTRLKEDEQRSSDRDVRPAGGNSGVTIPPAYNRFQYGFYEDQQGAEAALEEITNQLQQNAPLRINEANDNFSFVVPASSVHYVACAEVVRPMDRGENRTEQLSDQSS